MDDFNRKFSKSEEIFHKQKLDLKTSYNTIQKHKASRNNTGGLEDMKNIMKYNMCNCKPRKSKVRHGDR